MSASFARPGRTASVACEAFTSAACPQVARAPHARFASSSRAGCFAASLPSVFLGRCSSGREQSINGASSGASTSIFQAAPPVQTVGDIMTTGVRSVKPDDTVDAALHMLVNFKITGLPVVDDAGVVVGVVSDFDLLALDALGRCNEAELFPMADQTWQAFKEVKSMLARTSGKKIKDVMTADPKVVMPEMCLEDATRLLLCHKIRRLPVVDKDGKLVGILSRGNIVQAALAQRILEAPPASAV